MKARHHLCAAAAIAALACSSVAAAAGTLRIALIDPLSGPFGLVGESIARHLQLAVDDLNARGGVLGGVQLELVTYDSKLSPQESVLLLKRALDEGIRYVTQSSGSNVAHALVDAVEKHNRRHPDEAVVFLNFGAQDPALTNEKCSFWHFRFDGNTDMKLNVLTSYMASRAEVRKVYLINQDFAYGQAISRGAREQLRAKRSAIEIVGDDLHPLLKVKDFSAYAAKIRASGADSVVTGNGGPDFYLLVKAVEDAGLEVRFFTLNAHTIGVASSIRDAGADRIRQVLTWHANLGEGVLGDVSRRYRARFGEGYWYQIAKTEIDMLGAAIEKAGSLDPVSVARALEGMRFSGSTGEVWMRADDHQLVQPLFMASYRKADAGAPHDIEGTGYAWHADARIEAPDTVLPTSCRMKRP